MCRAALRGGCGVCPGGRCQRCARCRTAPRGRPRSTWPVDNTHKQTSAISAWKRGVRRRAPTRREHFPAYVIALPRAPAVLIYRRRSGNFAHPQHLPDAAPRQFHRQPGRRLPGPAPRAPLPRDRAGILGAQPGAHSPELQDHPAEA